MSTTLSSPEYSTSMTDWGTRLERGESIIPPPKYPQTAEIAWGVMSQLKVTDVAGRPALGDISPPWVKDLALAFFGSLNEETGERDLRELLLLIPKKSAKSTVAAAIMITAIVLNWRDNAEFIIVAPSVQAASNSFRPAAAMVRADPRLNRLFRISEHQRTITHMTTGATLKILSASVESVVGSKASLLLVDELHALAHLKDASEILSEARGGLASRPEGAVVIITTQSSEPPCGVFKEALQIHRDVRDGVLVDNSRLPVLYEHPREWVSSGRARTLEGVFLTNPSLGYSTSKRFLEQEFTKAQSLGGTAEQEFFSKYANIEVGLNLRSDRWAGADFWEAAADPSLTLETLIQRCDVATVGIDGGGLDDLLGLTVVGRCKSTRKWLSWSKAWAHRIALQRRKDIASRLEDFSREGDLTIVDLPGHDVEQVCQIVMQLELAGLLPEKNAIGVDPVGISAIVDQLTGPDYGLDISRVVAVSQGYRLSGSIKTTERALAGGTLVHAKQALMDWCVGNARIEIRGSALYVTKSQSGTAKIDPLIAMFNSVALIALNPSGRGTLDGYLSSFTSR
ncbi:terminase large subunit [Xanthomonas phage CP1]|uniref:Terminase large subunit n=1 Tax=Xanthomonas phage CP1 TaxID=2994055 RepID=I7H415_9CAUD|nr:terminase large subunit [Xanthomonas phage CP1]BAM29076.1 putative terminase large subunit [Xanthomonas phage CP1]